MEDVGRLPAKRVRNQDLTTKKSAISLKESAFFEYRWYRILEALHQDRENLSLEDIVQRLRLTGARPNEVVLREDLVRLEEQEYVESRRENEFPPVKRFRLTPLGTQKVKRMLRKL
ncbi:MAG: hypothetical protein ACE5QF_05505 [Thermoplasmata archaeon]